MIDFEFLKSFWWVVGKSSDLSANRPLNVRLFGQEFVLFRGADGKVTCFEDRCPHRQVPLSLGRVVDCQLQCPYHGWEFDRSGNCTKVPGRIGNEFKAPLMTPFQTHEAHGLIWICVGENRIQTDHRTNEPTDRPTTQPPSKKEQPYLSPHLVSSEMKTKIHTFKIATNMIDILENFMDPFHTAILHDGLIRKDTIRSINKIMPRHTEDGFEVRYQKQAAQSNWFRHFQRNIDLDLGRFRMPGIIELEFFSKEVLEFANTFYISPIDQDHVLMVTVVSIKQRIIPASILFFFAKMILMRALKQDIWMLEIQNKARHQHPGRKQIILETDIVRRQLELSLNGRTERVAFQDFEAML